MKIIQITDTHLVRPGRRVNGVDPEAQLRAAIADIVDRHADAELLAITGDLCDDGDPEAYGLLDDILAPLPFPYRLMLGNHDHRPAFVGAFPHHPRDAAGYVQSWLDTKHGRLLFLDTHEAGVIGGIYGPDRLAWLDAALEGAGEEPVTVFLHHPPMPDGLAHFRNIGLHDDGAVMARLRAHRPGVRHVVFGHVHVPIAGNDRHGIAFSSGQACAHRFVTDIDDLCPAWTDGRPCYRVLVIDDFGFRAYASEVGETPTAKATFCAGP